MLIEGCNKEKGGRDGESESVVLQIGQFKWSGNGTEGYMIQ